MPSQMEQKIAHAQTALANIKKEIAQLESKPGDEKNLAKIAAARDSQAETQRLLQGLIAKQKALEDEWNGLQPRLAEFRTRLKTLTDFGALDVQRFGIAHFPQTLAGIEKDGGQREFEGANNHLKDLLPMMDKPWAEYGTQAPAKPEFEQAMQEARTRLDQVRSSPYQIASVTAGIAEAEAGLAEADRPVAELDFVVARDLVARAIPRLTALEEELVQLGKDEDELRAALAELRHGFQGHAASEFDEVKALVQQAEGNLAALEQTIAAYDFAPARDMVARTRAELDAVTAEAQRLEAEKQARIAEEERLRKEWEAAAPRLASLNEQLAKLEDWQDPDAPAIRQSVQRVEQAAGEGLWAEALAALPPAEDQIRLPYEQYLVQVAAKETYLRTRPELDRRAAAARASQYLDAAVTAQLDEVAADFALMAEQEAARHFTGANDRTAATAQKLDRIEQALRELEIRAKVAGEMGGASDAEIEAEVNRRLYYAEHPEVERRAHQARDRELADAATATQIAQIIDQVESSYQDFSGQRYAEALQVLRSAGEALPPVEAELQKQEERRQLLRDAVEKVRQDAEALGQSPFREIKTAVETLNRDLGQGEALMQSREFARGLELARGWQTAVGHMLARNAELGMLAARADAELAALRPRLDLVLSNTAPRLAQGRDALAASEAEVRGLMENEDFAAVLTAVGPLAEKLAEFEKEALVEAQRAGYEALLASITPAERLDGIARRRLPELDDAETQARAADKTQAASAAAGRFEEARAQVLALEGSIAALEREATVIEAAGQSYQSRLAALGEAISAALAPHETPSQDLLAKQEALKAALAAAAKAASERRFTAAVAELDKAESQIAPTREAWLSSTKVPEKVVSNWIFEEFRLFRSGMISAMYQALSDFGIKLQKRLSDGRTPAKWAKIASPWLDSAAIASKSIPKYGELVALGISISKLAISIGVEAYDEFGDKKDQKIADDLVNKLKEQVGSRIHADLNPEQFPASLKAKRPDLYDKIWVLLSKDDKVQARAVLAGIGVVGAGFDAFQNEFSRALDINIFDPL